MFSSSKFKPFKHENVWFPAENQAFQAYILAIPTKKESLKLDKAWFWTLVLAWKAWISSQKLPLTRYNLQPIWGTLYKTKIQTRHQHHVRYDSHSNVKREFRMRLYIFHRSTYFSYHLSPFVRSNAACIRHAPSSKLFTIYSIWLCTFLVTQ